MLKSIAKELNVPVLALVSCCRTAWTAPIFGSAQSGSIEQDADVVMFVYREYYLNKKPDRRIPT